MEKKSHLAPFKMMPTRHGTCPECGIAHPKEYPHKQNSLAYQYSFYNDHGRFPTWEDALSHCDEEMKAKWIKSLKELGIDV